MVKIDIVERLRFDAVRCEATFSKGVAGNIEEAADEIERLRAALSSCQSWVDRWTEHVGNCEGGDKCTCGRSAILFDANEALNQQQGGEK